MYAVTQGMPRGGGRARTKVVAKLDVLAMASLKAEIHLDNSIYSAHSV